MDDTNDKDLCDRLDNFIEWTKEVDKRDREFDAQLRKILENLIEIEKNLDAKKIKRTTT